MREAIDSPTGELTPEIALFVAGQVQSQHSAFKAAIQILEHLFPADSDGGDDGGGASDDGGAGQPHGGNGLEGTSVYVEISCPGPDPSVLDTTFELGSLRVDSPRLTDSFLSTAELEGDLLFQAFHCQVPEGEVDGYFPTHYRKSPRDITIRTAPLAIDPWKSGAPSLEVNTAIVLGEAELRISVEAADLGTFAAGMSLDSLDSIWVRGHNAEVDCDLSSVPPTCDTF